MPADIPARRSKTAREIAEQLGVSVRTVVRIAAEPRDQFLGRARARRDQAVALRRTGVTYAVIAEALDTTVGPVGRLLSDARRLGEWDGVIDQRPDPEDSAQKAS
ncbi:MAG: Sigma-70, region 4 [Actinobacteria bacterium ADurb.Bin444]|nr:MAG: Sigma-70, region 4 [Actinobacteria bacterium ADurb.Bin444]